MRGDKPSKYSQDRGIFFSVLQIPADIEEFIHLLKNVLLGELISGKHSSIQALKAKSKNPFAYT